MFTPVSWPHRIFLIVVSLAAISPYIGVSLVCSAVLVAYMVWDWRQGRHRDAVVRCSVSPDVRRSRAAVTPPPPPISV